MFYRISLEKGMQSLLRSSFILLLSLLLIGPVDAQQVSPLQTVPGKSFFVCLRMYGPEQPWIDGVWRPSDVVLVK